jgi:hypothetical protein
MGESKKGMILFLYSRVTSCDMNQEFTFLIRDSRTVPRRWEQSDYQRARSHPSREQDDGPAGIAAADQGA